MSAFLLVRHSKTLNAQVESNYWRAMCALKKRNRKTEVGHLAEDLGLSTYLTWQIVKRLFKDDYLILDSGSSRGGVGGQVCRLNFYGEEVIRENKQMLIDHQLMEERDFDYRA